ncbi:MAG: fused MFS/spermidine synthase [Pseudomonadota bacterium]
MPPTSPRLALLAPLFVLTGAVALVAEQVFEKLLSTVVGASTPAGALVLAVYFAGLTLGGLLYPLAAGRLRRPLWVYAACEGFVGLWALGLALGFSWWQVAGGALVALAGEGTAAVILARLAVASAWILPPTVAMGMTFPAMVGALEAAEVPGLHRRMARFYALNLLGAAAAAGLAPYLLFPRLGLVGALYTCALAEAGVVAAVLVLGRVAARPGSVRPALSFAALRVPGALGLVTLAAGSGAVAFALEVLWLHLVGAALGTSVYAFANMLLAVLLGLLAGGWLASLGRDRGAALPPAVVAAALLVAGWLLLLTLRVWDDVPLLLPRFEGWATGFARGELLRIAFSLALVGLPAAALGAVYPLIFRLRAYPREGADTFAGLLAAANALGCIAGALGTGFGLIPALGAESTLRGLVALVLVAGLGLLGGALRRPTGRLGRPLAMALGVLAALGLAALVKEPPWDRLALTSGTNVYFRPVHVMAGSTLLFWHEDTRGGFTTVVENRLPNGATWKVLLTDGKFQGNDAGERAAQAAFALVPLLHTGARGRALVVGLGTGQTADLVAAAGFDAVEVAELAPGMVAAARGPFAEVNRGVLDRPGVALFVEDGRNHLLRSRERYDLVTIELSSVWFAGSSSLYSREFYRLVREHLAPGGVVAQWIQLHHIAPEEVLSVVATLREGFPHVAMWQVGGQGMLLASAEPLRAAPARLVDLRARPALADALALVAEGVPPEELVARTAILGEAELEARLAQAPDVVINSDGNRYLELATPRHNLEPGDHRAWVLASLLEGLDPTERAARLERLGR